MEKGSLSKGSCRCDTVWRFKPGDLKTGAFATFLVGKGPDCVVDPFGNVPCRSFIISREVKRKRTNREKSLKISGKSQRTRTNRDGRAQIGKPPCVNPLRLAAP